MTIHKKHISDILKNRYACSILYGLLLFFLLMSFWNQGVFGSDEGEIFIKGRQIAAEDRLYSDVLSQHMPVMYYIAAVFAKAGARSAYEFRMCFYALFAVMWSIMYFYFGKRLGDKKVALYAIIYLILEAGISQGTCILSEQLQGIGMVILLYELLMFYERKSFTFADSVLISLAVFISFGSAFVSAFGIFAVAVSVLLLEIRELKAERYTLGTGLFRLIKKYVVLFIVIALPFAALLIYYKSIHSLKNFYAWAYLLNREVYVKYTSGYGGSVLSAMFGGIGNIAGTFIVSEISTIVIVNFMAIFIAVLFLVHLFKQTGDGLIVTGLIFVIVTSATRGLFEFHGLAAIAVISALDAMCLVDVAPAIRNWVKESQLKIATFIFVSIFLASSYLEMLPQSLAFTRTAYYKNTDTQYILTQITEEDERIGFSVLDCNLLLQSKTLPTFQECGQCPWFWEWCSEKAMQKLNENKPRVYVYNPDQATWGYKMTDYAPELKEYIDEGYVNLSGIVYVAKEYYYEAHALYRPDQAFYEADGSGGNVGKVLPGVSVGQRFVATEDCDITKIGVKFYTYARNNDCTLVLQLMDINTGDSVELTQTSCDGFEDGGQREISFAPQEIIKGHTYEVRFSSPDASEDNSITIGRSKELYNEVARAYINEEPQDYSLTMTVYTDCDQPAPVIEIQW